MLVFAAAFVQESLDNVYRLTDLLLFDVLDEIRAKMDSFFNVSRIDATVCSAINPDSIRCRSAILLPFLTWLPASCQLFGKVLQCTAAHCYVLSLDCTLHKAVVRSLPSPSPHHL